MITHPLVPTRLFADPDPRPEGLARALCDRGCQLTRRFFAIRPELDRGDGRWGAALALTWLAERAAEEAPLATWRGGEPFWDMLACLRLPGGHEMEVVVDAAVGFIGFVGSTGLLPRAEADRLRQEARVEGLAFLASQMGLLSPAEVAERRGRYAR